MGENENFNYSLNKSFRFSLIFHYLKQTSLGYVFVFWGGAVIIFFGLIPRCGISGSKCMEISINLDTSQKWFSNGCNTIYTRLLAIYVSTKCTLLCPAWVLLVI